MDQKRGHRPIISEDIHPLASVVGSIIAKSHEHMLGRTDVEKKKKRYWPKVNKDPEELSYISDFVLCSQPLSRVQLFCVGPHELYPTRLLCPCDFPNKNTGVCCHFLLQGIFLTQGLNLCLLLCRRILYH